MANDVSRYEIRIAWSDPDGLFLAEVPDLPGCLADGETYEEALANAHVIIREWIDVAAEFGMPIPEPKGRLSVV
jgi:predicted RNase H-like HicB family nuclease